MRTLFLTYLLLAAACTFSWGQATLLPVGGSITVAPGKPDGLLPTTLNGSGLKPKRCRITLTLPKGNYTTGTLLFTGLGFNPGVQVNGITLNEAGPGSGHFSLPLAGKVVLFPGATFAFDLDVPGDLNTDSPDFKNNIGLRLHGDRYISRVSFLPQPEKGRLLAVVETGAITPDKRAVSATAELLSGTESLATSEKALKGNPDTISLDASKLKLWTPEHPNCYTLRLSLKMAGTSVDEQTVTYGYKELSLQDKLFLLNGKPARLRGLSLNWQNVRNQNKAFAADSTWFKTHIIKELKERGGNALSFMGGTPPDFILELADKNGLILQTDFPFGTDTTAKPAEQSELRNLLALTAKHPSLCLIKPRFPRNPDSLAARWFAASKAMPDYLTVINASAGLQHLSATEAADGLPATANTQATNSGNTPNLPDYTNYLHALSADDFSTDLAELKNRPFNPLNPENTSLLLHTAFWRQRGIAAVFIGPLFNGTGSEKFWYAENPAEMTTAAAIRNDLTAALCPRALIADFTDENAAPGQSLRFNIFAFNDKDTATTHIVRVELSDSSGYVFSKKNYFTQLLASSHKRDPLAIDAPRWPGTYKMEVILLKVGKDIKHPVIGRRYFRVTAPKAPADLRGKYFAVMPAEPELTDLLKNAGLTAVPPSDVKANIIIAGPATCRAMQTDGGTLLNTLSGYLKAGKSVVLLGAGPQAAAVPGQKYPDTLMLLPSPEPCSRYAHFAPVASLAGQRLSPAPTLRDSLPQTGSFILNGMPRGTFMPPYIMSLRKAKHTWNCSQTLLTQPQYKDLEHNVLATALPGLSGKPELNPVCKIVFGKKEGKLVLSQLYTTGRLLPDNGPLPEGSPRYDPIAVQLVYNMLLEAGKK